MYIGDLHIHSRYSRATSKDGCPEYLDLWARKKGIGLIGTGDFTHPAWRQELMEKLTPAEEGLYVLKKEYRLEEAKQLSGPDPRFVVTGEISSIYKKQGKVRKVHSVIMLPGLSAASRLSSRLETMGNIHSDGRPILGLDCRDLLEIALEQEPETVFVPAHIWTPHFSMFGAFSGFDTVEECFEDLTPYIHAVETGLSSDPPMNWRLSALDRFQLISNSDAHSPSKLGREANIFGGELSYKGLYQAVQMGKGLEGTIEFFPEEGKYHYDGHRKCRLCLTPLEAEEYGNICPVCAGKLTIGVSHRVWQLADREEGYVPDSGRPFESLVPLPEVIAACTGHSASSAKVEKKYEDLIRHLGPEFEILRNIPIEEIENCVGYLIGEGIRRLRKGQVSRIPGYDGEYGKIQLFSQDERENLQGQMSFFSVEQMAGMDMFQKGKTQSDKICCHVKNQSAAVKEKKQDIFEKKTADREESYSWLKDLNQEQLMAVSIPARAVCVKAGPGTGKTKTLVSRILYLMKERGVKAGEITAVTFTRKAAEEMRKRLEKAMGGKRLTSRMRIGTFHSICLDLLKKQGVEFTLADQMELLEFASDAVEQFQLPLTPSRFLEQVSRHKTGLDTEEDQGQTALAEAMAWYGEELRKQTIFDFDDLLLETLKLLKEEKKNQIRKQGFSYVLTDEFQDMNPLQYQLLIQWNRDGRELFVIGDPNQAIYGFRGADKTCFDRLRQQYPEMKEVRLVKNYRSSPEIIDSAVHVLGVGEEEKLIPVRQKNGPVRIVSAAGSMSEGIFAAREINRLIGGIDMLDAEKKSGKIEESRIRGFGDIALLYRTHRQASVLEKCLRKEGIPCVIWGRESFLEHPKVRAAVCFFKMVLQPQQDLSRRIWEKLQSRQWKGKKAAFDALEEELGPFLKKERPKKLIARWLDAAGETAEGPLEHLLETAAAYKTMPELLEALSFAGEGELKRAGGKVYHADAVNLMTLHGSKGLEFPAVILCGADEGVIPMEREGKTSDREEERRLLYVGMTRAEEELILTAARKESSFLKELKSPPVVREKAGNRESSTPKQMSLFDFISPQ